MKTPAAVQLLLPEMGGITGFYEARTDRVRCAGTPTLAGTPIAEPDCGDLHCNRCRQPLRPVNRRDEPNAAPGLFASRRSAAPQTATGPPRRVDVGRLQIRARNPACSRVRAGAKRG